MSYTTFLAFGCKQSCVLDNARQAVQGEATLIVASGVVHVHLPPSRILETRFSLRAGGSAPSFHLFLVSRLLKAGVVLVLRSRQPRLGFPQGRSGSGPRTPARGVPLGPQVSTVLVRRSGVHTSQ